MWILSLANCTEHLARWRLKLFQLDFYAVHHAGFKHQVSDALAQLNTTDQDESTLEAYSPLYAISNHNNLPHSAHSVLHDVNHVQVVQDTSPSCDKAEYTPQTAVKIVRAHQYNTLYRTAAAQVGQRNCDFKVYKKGLLVLKARIDSAIQIAQHL